jgi:protein TonB
MKTASTVFAILLSMGLHALVILQIFGSGNALGGDGDGGHEDFTAVATVSLEPEFLSGTDRAEQSQQDPSIGGEQNSAGEKATPNKEEPKKSTEKQQETERKPEQTASGKKTEDVLSSKNPDAEPEQPKEAAQQTPEKPMERQANRIAPEQTQLERLQAATRDLEAEREALVAKYKGEIYRALQRHSVKPKVRASGDVILQLVLAPSGQVLSRSIQRTSGVPALDAAALTALERAAPFPAMPPQLGGQPMALNVPFHYVSR